MTLYIIYFKDINLLFNIILNQKTQMQSSIIAENYIKCYLF